MAVKIRIQIGAKPEEVFEYASDVSRHGEWANPAANLAVTKTSDGPVGVGSTFRSTQKFAGKPASAEITVAQYQPPRMFKITAVQGSATFSHTFTFEPSGEGTLVTKEIVRENASPFAAFAMVLFSPAIKADAMKGLRNLKAKVESRPS